MADLQAETPAWLARVMLLVSAVLIVGAPAAVVFKEASKPRELTAAERHAREVAAMPRLDLTEVARGKRLYDASCIACHGQHAEGVPNLGRDLVQGVFARTVSDDAFVKFIINGRKQGDPGFTGPVAMPPRGGRPDYDDEAIRSVVVYLRALQEPSRINNAAIPDAHVELLDGPVEPVAPVATAVAANAGAPAAVGFDPEQIKRGKRVYASCIACHAKDGTGVKGQGASLLDSTFIKGKTDAELREFIKTGRTPGAPGSRLNLTMPPKGGNPALKDNQLDDVVVYVRSLIQQAEEQKK